MALSCFSSTSVVMLEALMQGHGHVSALLKDESDKENRSGPSKVRFSFTTGLGGMCCPPSARAASRVAHCYLSIEDTCRRDAALIPTDLAPLCGQSSDQYYWYWAAVK